jgi:hypothetical protein
MTLLLTVLLKQSTSLPQISLAPTPVVESESELEFMIGKSREIGREQKDTR